LRSPASGTKKNEEKAEGYYVRERVSGSMRRIVWLPAEVMEENARAGFKNGVLEVILKKQKAHQRPASVSNDPLHSFFTDVF
jgi:HSP20 family protein